MFGLLVIATWAVGMGWLIYEVKTAPTVKDDIDI